MTATKEAEARSKKPEDRSKPQADWSGYAQVDRICCPCKPDDPVMLRPENVIQHDDRQLGVRVVRGHCHECNRVLRITRKLGSGGYEITGVEVLSEKDRVGFFARRDHLLAMSRHDVRQA